jgi:ribosomal subunit interface protein
MPLPVQITFHNLDRSEAVEAQVRERAEKLDRIHRRLHRCRVAVEARHRRHQQGRLYRVRIDLTLPGGEIVVGRTSDDNHAHEDVYVAIRDAFDAAQRQLEEHVRAARGEVKTHARPGLGA